MKYIASCSFGKDSMATILLALEHNEPLDYIIYSEVMFDEKTSGEYPEHRDFIYNVAIPRLEELGCKIKVLRSNETYLSNFNYVVKKSKDPNKNGKKRSFPIAGLCVINNTCKIKPIKKFNKEIGKHITYVGIAVDEPKRLKTLRKDSTKVSLLEKYNYTEEMATELCKKYELLSPIYKHMQRCGCWFCPNINLKQLGYLKNNNPELVDRLLELEKDDNLVTKKFNRQGTFSDFLKKEAI